MNHAEPDENAQKWVIYSARFGYTTKGIVYILLGILALKAGIQAGNAKIHIRTILVTVLDQPFGQVLLGMVILGLIGYAVWRTAQSIFDLDHKGRDTSGLVLRVSFFISGAGYAVLAYSGIKMLMRQSSSQASMNIKKAAEFTYHLPLGSVWVGIIGLILLAVSFFQFFGALSANFEKHFDLSEVGKKTEKAILILGRVGYAARGIVYFLIGYSLVAAAVTLQPSLAGGYGYAFKTLNNIGQFPWVLEITAAGLTLYGFYALLLARYRWFQLE